MEPTSALGEPDSGSLSWVRRCPGCGWLDWQSGWWEEPPLHRDWDPCRWCGDTRIQLAQVRIVDLLFPPEEERV
jgi:hypothetical protein